MRAREQKEIMRPPLCPLVALAASTSPGGGGGRGVAAPPPAPPGRPSLTGWLLGHGASLQSSVENDPAGLRGLRWGARDGDCPGGGGGGDGGGVACLIPRGCAVVADPALAPAGCGGPIERLAGTLLRHVAAGAAAAPPDHFSPYLDSLPPPADPALASIGGTWTDRQLGRLALGPVQRSFRGMRERRERFVRAYLREGDVPRCGAKEAAWAYDIASSRALEGNFGRGGAVRASLGTVGAAFALALAAPGLAVLLAEPESATATTATAVPLIALAPLAASLAVLGGIMVGAARQPELALVPWIDFANHQSSAGGLVFQYDCLRDAIQLRRREGGSHATSEEDGWITFDYGGAAEGITNDRLLGEYGFVEEDNPNDTLVIEVGDAVLTLGRHGRRGLTGGGKLHTEGDVRDAIEATRAALAASQVPVDSRDPNDAILAGLAAQWRREKRRLLDEVSSEHELPRMKK